jgi:hypothetical protein
METTNATRDFRSFCGGDVTRMRGAIITAGLLLLCAAPAVSAQGLPGGRPANAIDRARGLATQPLSAPPPPQGSAERYVPPRRVYSPAQGREVLVPGHYERDVNGQRVETPPLVTTTPDGRNPTIVPGWERPPVEQRAAP